MRRATLALQLALAASLVLLWMLLRPASPDCGGDDSGCDDIFVTPIRVSPPEPIDLPFEVEYGGCMMIVTSPSDEIECVYDPGKELYAWVTHSRPAEVWLELDGTPLTTETYEVREEPGQGFRVRLASDDARRLVVRVRDDTWELRLRSSKHLAHAQQQILSTLDDRATRLQGQLYLGQLEALPDVNTFIDELLAAGLLSLAVDEALANANHLREQSARLDLAEQLLARVEGLATRYPEGRAALSIYRGHVLAHRGHLVDAAVAYREGGHHALRTRNAALQLDALSDYAMMLSELGYFEAAFYWGERALAIAQSTGRIADRVAVRIMVARVYVRLLEAGQTSRDPESVQRDVLPPASLVAATKEDPGELEPARLVSARLAVIQGRLDDALDEIDRIDMDRLTPEERVDARDVELQALLARKAPLEALQAALSRLETLATSSASPSAAWLVAVRKGQVAEQARDLVGAQRAYEESEVILDQIVPLALLGAQGELTPARRRDGTERLVSLLLRLDRPAEAFCALRRAHARSNQIARRIARLDEQQRRRLHEATAHYLEAQRKHESLQRDPDPSKELDRHAAMRDAQRLQGELDRLSFEIFAPTEQAELTSCEDLRPRQPGELLLGLYELHDGLLVLAEDDRGTTHLQIANPEVVTKADDLAWLGDILLEPLDERLARAKRVRVLSSGSAAAIDVHALPWRERSLVEGVPVVYGLDLPPRPLPGSTGREPTALVLADPRAKGATNEADIVSSMLSAAGWTTEQDISARIERRGLKAAIERVDHFHYAGHNEYGKDLRILRLWPPYPGGAEYLPSHIEVGKQERLDVQDVLLMKHVPRTVVLMGCQTGAYDERVFDAGISLAAAFLDAGTEAVVASTRDIDGGQASKLGRGLYVGLEGRELGEPGEWFRSAVLWAREQGMLEAAVRDYRVMVP